MGKFGKNRFKALNKIAKNQKTIASITTNKVIKKKLNAEKKVTFQKEVMLKEAATGANQLVKNVSARKVLIDELSQKSVKRKPKLQKQDEKQNLKPVEKHKKRQKTLINDTKLLLNLMKKKK